MSNNETATALTAFKDFSNDSDAQIHSRLVAGGMDRRTAARLIEFIPAACCRLLLSKSGVHFSEKFRRVDGDARFTVQSLNTEPVWREVWSYVSEIGAMQTPTTILEIAARSAEFNAVNQLLNNGSTPQNIRLGPTTFAWPDCGPPSDD
jgi:hypothetical protein